MGINLSTVNLDGVEANAALDPIPAGWYNSVIVNTEMKPNKDQTGMYMEITEQVVDGPFAGRKLFDRLNLQNPNPTAVEIAFKTLKAVYNAVGKARVNDSSELHGIPHKVKVKMKAATAEYSANNEIQGYDHVNSDHAVNTGGPAAPAFGGAPAAGAGAAPWAAGAPAAPAAPAAPGFAPAAAAQPWAQPGAAAPAFAPPAMAAAAPPAPPAFAPPAPAATAFPPPGWTPHPSAPGYYYAGQEVLSEADLRARASVPAAPAAPAAPAFTAPGAPAPATAAPGGPTPPWAT